MHWEALPAWAQKLFIFVLLILVVLVFLLDEPLLIVAFLLVAFIIIFLAIRSPKRKTHSKTGMKRWLTFSLRGMIVFFALGIFFYIRGWDGAVYISGLLVAGFLVHASTALLALWRNT